ncbi:protease complex subunit PrcB family protein [Blautia sp. MSJ-19]|uniref:protease complex subunit PrcB family protein n=1 Tax=Blautia sp. MSJ-19 TaxID=2841517 RepID=UPI001C0F2943|nr:protease complex subunit PrcB family protein [Blautia sp. MSJ-19]MBU5482098.1 protease complex subunit PrcB family protein [Blautia sp. MSJ-19]
MKKILALLGLAVLFFTLCGCRAVRIEEGNRTPLSYTVAEFSQIPEEAQELIREKKESEFQLAYQRGEDLFLIKGYGRQMSGGYSIQVKELSASSNAIFFETKLIGPSEEVQGGEPSFPYIVIRTEYRDVPVQFQ